MSNDMPAREECGSHQAFPERAKGGARSQGTLEERAEARKKSIKRKCKNRPYRAFKNERSCRAVVDVS